MSHRTCSKGSAHDTQVDPVTAVESIAPIRGDEAVALATAEYGRLLDLLRALDPADWQRPTDCDWNGTGVASSPSPGARPPRVL